jgi:mono/diheme cytochrome c family protein
MKIWTGITLATILAATTVTSAFAQGSGADVYTSTKCAMCHGATGTGNAGMKVPPFKSPDAIKATDTALSAAIKNGAGTGTIKMPAYAAKLTDAQIKSVVAYIRTLQK